MSLFDAVTKVVDSNKKDGQINKTTEKRRINLTEAEQLRLKGENTRLKEDVSSLNKNIDMYIKEVEDLENQVEKLEGKIVDPKKLGENLRKELETAYKKIDSQTKEIKQLEQLRNNLSAQRLQKVECKLNEKIKQVKQLEDEVKVLKNQNRIQERKIDKLQDENDEPKSEATQLLYQIEGYQDQIQELNEQLEKKEEIKKKMMDTIGHSEEKYRKLCREIGIIPKNNTQYQVDNKEELRKITQYLRQQKKIQEDYKDLEENYKKMQLKQMANEKEQNQKIKGLESQVKQLKKETEEAKESKEIFEHRNKQMEHQNLQNERQIKELKSEIKLLKRARSQSHSNSQYLEREESMEQSTPVSQRQKWNQQEQNKKDFKGNLPSATHHFSDIEKLQGQKGRIIEITVWNNGNEINGIQFTYQLQYFKEEIQGDKHYQQNGGESQENVFRADKDDFIKICRCHLNEQGFIDGLYFKTKLGKEYKIGKCFNNLISYNMDHSETPGNVFGGLCVQDGGQSLLCYLGFEIRKDFHQMENGRSPLKKFLGKSDSKMSPYKKRENKSLNRLNFPSIIQTVSGQQ